MLALAEPRVGAAEIGQARAELDRRGDAALVDRDRALEQRARARVLAAVEIGGALAVEIARDRGGVGLGCASFL